jgi:predicted transcriptional regulator
MSARDHVPLRSRSSSRSASLITSYSHPLTRRDFEILIELYEHRVLTTPQIYELHFDTHTRASKRMLELYRLGLVERFRPHTPTGSAPWHYTLDEPGARLVAARQQIDYERFTFKKAREISFFLEYDRGTENHDQLENKTCCYRLVGRTARSEDALLFVFASAARERYARSALVGASVPVATAVRGDVLRHPLGTVWLPLHDDRRRPILDLPRLPRDHPE